MKIVSIFLFSLILNLFTLAQAHAQNFYQQNISDNGYKFTVIQKDNYLIIKPLTFSIVNNAEKHDITNYTVRNVEICDLNNDNYPELIIFLTNKQDKVRIIGYSSNNGKSMSRIYMPEIKLDGKINTGYINGENMYVKNNVFTCIFPVYRHDKQDIQLTDTVRKIEYKLIDGENGRILQPEKITQYTKEKTVLYNSL